MSITVTKSWVNTGDIKYPNSIPICYLSEMQRCVANEVKVTRNRGDRQALIDLWTYLELIIHIRDSDGMEAQAKEMKDNFGQILETLSN